MRILNITQAYYPFLERGGPTVKVRALARGMADAGHQVTVLTADLGFDASARKLVGGVPGRWGLEAEEDRVQAIYLRTRARYRSLTWNPGLRAVCREQAPRHDVAHIYGLYDFMGPVAASSCRSFARPYVVEPMGMFRPIIRKIRVKRMYHALMGSRMLRGAARLIATSEQERDELLEGGIPQEKIVVRRNGIIAPVNLPPRGSFRNQWNISPNIKLLLFLGRLVSKKSPQLLLEAFMSWRQQNGTTVPSLLVIAGPDEGDGFRQRLEASVMKMGLQGGVLFTGPLYDDAKWAAYRDVDLFVLPSQNENFGNTAAEAVACGTPVLVTDQCGIAPLVRERAGLVVPHERAALAEGIGRILDDPVLSAKLRAGCSEVAKSLGWAEPLSQMESLYQELISKDLQK